MRILPFIVASALLSQQESQAVQVKVLNQNRALAGTRTTSYANNRAILGTMTLADCEAEYQRSGYILADCEKYVQTGVVTQPVNNIQVTPPQLNTALVQQVVPVSQYQPPHVLGQIRDQSQVPFADHLGQIPQPVQPPLQVLTQAPMTSPLQNPVTAMATPTALPTVAQAPMPVQTAPVTGIAMAQTDQDSLDDIKGGVTGQSMAQVEGITIYGLGEAKKAAERKKEIEHAHELQQIAAQTNAPPPAPTSPSANMMIQTESKLSQVPVSHPLVAAQTMHMPVSQVFGATVPVAQAQVAAPAPAAAAPPVAAKTEAAQSDSTAAAQEKTESDADEGTTDTALAQNDPDNCDVTCCGCTSGDILNNFIVLMKDMTEFGEEQVKDEVVVDQLIKYIYVDSEGKIVPKPPNKPSVPVTAVKTKECDCCPCCCCSCGCSFKDVDLSPAQVQEIFDLSQNRKLTDKQKGEQMAELVQQFYSMNGGSSGGCCC